MNDERPIEKLLRRYAKNRRDATPESPGLEPHPATRRLLQGEVARQFRKTAVGDSSASRGRWLPWLAWALPVVLLGGFGLWSLVSRPETKQLVLGSVPRPAVSDKLAKSDAVLGTPAAVPAVTAETISRDRADMRAAAPNPASAPVATANAVARSEAALGATLGVADREKAGARATLDETTRTTGAAKIRFEPADSRLGGATADAYGTRQNSSESDALAFASKTSSVAAPSRNAPGKPESLARGDVERENLTAYSQTFAQAPPRPGAAAVAPAEAAMPVLANFRVEQTGRRLRVVDADGSTYLGETDASALAITGGGSGSIGEQAVQTFKNKGQFGTVPAATNVPPLPAQSNFFRVSGTNRTLNQRVVFTWNYVTLTNQFASTQLKDSGAIVNQDGKKLPPQFPAQLQNSFITGRAQLGAGKEIEINAVPVAP